jgi:hypothetical protein
MASAGIGKPVFDFCGEKRGGKKGCCYLGATQAVEVDMRAEDIKLAAECISEFLRAEFEDQYRRARLEQLQKQEQALDELKAKWRRRNRIRI